MILNDRSIPYALCSLMLVTATSRDKLLLLVLVMNFNDAQLKLRFCYDGSDDVFPESGEVKEAHSIGK